MDNQGKSTSAFTPSRQNASPAEGESSSFPGILKIFRGLVEAVAGIPPEVKGRFADESLCRRCGQCCYSGIRVQERMILLRDLPCKHLSYEPDGKAVCLVYPVRERTGWCNKLSVESIRHELYPPTCPYVQGIHHYQGKIELSDAEFEEIKPILRKIFKGFPRPEYVRPSAWENFLARTLGLDR